VIGTQIGSDVLSQFDFSSRDKIGILFGELWAVASHFSLSGAPGLEHRAWYVALRTGGVRGNNCHFKIQGDLPGSAGTGSADEETDLDH
jgi:hypothetical protein